MSDSKGTLQTLLGRMVTAVLAFSSVGMAQVPLPNPIPTSIPVLQPPLVIWHGLGDSFDSTGIQSLVKLVETTNPGTYIHVIRLDEQNDSLSMEQQGTSQGQSLSEATLRPGLEHSFAIPLDASNDQKATLYGNVTEQLERVCNQLASDKVLSRVNKVNGLGLSQGGLFLRALVQKCDWFAGRVHSLVTLGSPHNGMADIRPCRPYDFVCRGAIEFLKSSAWTEWTQGHIVPAQYYRPLNAGGHGNEKGQEVPPISEYLENSRFLSNLNNEKNCYSSSKRPVQGSKDEVSRTEKCKTEPIFASRLSRSLRHLAMFAFLDDTVLLPPVSAWMVSTGASHVEDPFLPADSIPLHLRRFWTEDWIGLRSWAEHISRKESVPVRGRWDKDVPLLVGGEGEPIYKNPDIPFGDHIRKLEPEVDAFPSLFPPHDSQIPPIVFGTLAGQHMQIADTEMKPIIRQFFGPLRRLAVTAEMKSEKSNKKVEL